MPTDQRNQATIRSRHYRRHLAWQPTSDPRPLKMVHLQRPSHRHGSHVTILITWLERVREGMFHVPYTCTTADFWHRLIGIMLGRLRMNVDDCISEYETLGCEVFGHSRKCHIRSPLFWPRDKYKYKTLENVVRDVVRRRVPKVAEFPGGRNFAFDENRCRT